MRKDHRPYRLKVFMDRLNQCYVDWRIRPQLDSSGRDFRVMYPRHLQITGPRVHVGDHVHIMALYDRPVRLAVFEGMGEITIGNYSIVNPGVRISSASSINIGESCMLAMNAYLSDADWHDVQHRIFAPGKTAPIVIGNNCWIGESAFVAKGVTIGENSVVGAYAVVTTDVPANSIVAGVPARVIGQVDPDDITSRKQLFTADESYDEFEESYFSGLLAGNTLLNWLRTLILPGNKD